MATKDEITAALGVLISEARRIAGRFSDAEWAMEGDEGGWTNKQVLAHVAGVGGMVVPFVSNVAGAAAGTNLGDNFNIDAINAQIVAQRTDRTPAELAAEVESSYGAVIEFVRSAPDELLRRDVDFSGFRNISVGDLLLQMVALHGIAHIYHAASRV
jgi:hypothetical protein